MKKKRITLLALVLAFVFSLTVAVLAACSDDDRPAGDGTAVKLVTDDSLEGKLLAMYTFEDTGDTVSAIDPFTGEALRKVTEAELLNLSGGDYLYRIVDSNNYTSSDNGGYARSGLKLGANHAVTVNGAAAGEWYLYGDNYVYIELNGVKYYGVAMPAWLDACDKGGLAISCLSEDGGDCLYLDMTF